MIAFVNSSATPREMLMAMLLLNMLKVSLFFTVQIADMSTLQNLLAAHGSTHFQTSNGETIQIITVQNPQDIVNAGGVVGAGAGHQECGHRALWRSRGTRGGDE